MSTFLIDSEVEKVFERCVEMESLVGLAVEARSALRAKGHSWSVLEPGDCTRYEVAISVAIDGQWPGNRVYVVAAPNFRVSFSLGSLAVRGVYDIPDMTPWTRTILAYFVYLVGGGQPVH